MKQQDIEDLFYRIEVEGFEYALLYYSSWNTITDPEFQQLLKTYKEAHKAMSNFLGEASDWEFTDDSD